MTWKELENKIIEKTFSGICLLHGEEEYLKDIAIKRAIAAYIPKGIEDLNLDKLDTTDINKIKEVVNTPPFMAEKRIVIISSFKDFYVSKNKYKSAELEKTLSVISGLIENSNSDSCIFFLCRGKVDATNPLFKLFKKQGLDIAYNKIKEAEKVQVVLYMAKEKGVKINSSTAMFLLQYTGATLLGIEHEMDKLAAYEKGTIMQKHIEEVCHASADYNVFAMIKAISGKNKNNALKIFRQMMRNDEYLGSIVSLIERQYRILAYIEDIKSEYKGREINYSELEKRLNVKDFVLRNMYTQGLRMDEIKRNKIIQMCADADYLVKKGRLKDESAVENLIMNLISI